MSQTVYAFEKGQLEDLLQQTVQMFQEFRDCHGRTEPDAIPLAVFEMVQGLEMERALADVGHIATSQILPIVMPLLGSGQVYIFPISEHLPERLI